MADIASASLPIRQSPAIWLPYQLQPGDAMLILDGVSVGDALNRWRIRTTGSNVRPVEGWAIEVTVSGVKILDGVRNRCRPVGSAKCTDCETMGYTQRCTPNGFKVTVLKVVVQISARCSPVRCSTDAESQSHWTTKLAAVPLIMGIMRG